MSLIQEKLCSKILNEYFGNIVCQVGDILMKKGINTLAYIVQVSHLPRNKVQEALCVLIKHNLVIWEEARPGFPGYVLLNDRVLILLRYPRYVFLVREQYGEEAEMVVDIISKEGQATASQIVIFSSLKLLDASTEGNGGIKKEMEDKHITVRNAFEKLVHNEFIQRCPDPQDSAKPVPELIIKEEDLYRFNPTTLDLRLLQEEINERRCNTDQSVLSQPSKTIHKHPDKDIFWRLNYDRFHIELRDSEMRNSMSCRIDSLAGACLGGILKVSYRRNEPWHPTFQAISAAEVRDHLKNFSHLEQYLKVIVENGGGCLLKVGDAGGGEYSLSIATLIKSICLSHIDTLVQERFGSKAARIFRLVRENGMMEQDCIADRSMLSKKEANVLTHRLLNDNILRLYEVRKGITPSPASKSIYLFYVDLNMLVRMLLEWTYKALYNLMTQRDLKHNQHKRLLERKTRVEMIVENLRQSGATEEQIQEVEEMFSPSERETVNKVIQIQDKLLDFETRLDETIFILQMFLYYQTHKVCLFFLLPFLGLNRGQRTSAIKSNLSDGRMMLAPQTCV